MEGEAASHGGDTVTLVAEGRHFACHKAKLMASSDYFKAMFSSNFSENDKKLIELQDIDADSLGILVQHVEFGSLVIPHGVLPLLQISAMLQFTSVQAACEQHVLSSLTIDSCLEVYFITSSLGILSLASAALTVATWNFENLALTQQFQQLTITELEEYVSHPALHPGPNGEWGVWEALVGWIEVCEEERTQHLVRLLLCLDLHTLTLEDLANMFFFSVVSDNEEAVQFLECFKAFKKECCSQISNSVSSGTSGAMPQSSVWLENYSYEKELQKELRSALEIALKRPRRKLPQIPCVVGFRQTRPPQRRRKAKNSDDEDEERNYSLASRIKNLDITPVLFSFDPVQKRIKEEVTLTKLCSCPVQCSGYQVCAVGPSIFILGGEYQLGHGNWNMSVMRYSTVSRRWIEEHSLPRPRRHFMSCVVNSTIYLLGGFGRHRVIQSSVDSYDTASGEWLHCPDMPSPVSYAAVCSFEGRLLLFTQENQLLTFCPKLKRWSAMPLKAPNTLGYRAALTWKHYIYLIDSCTASVYRFKPGEVTVTRYGQFGAPPINVCVVDGTLYNFSHNDLHDIRVVEAMELDGGDKNIKSKDENSDAKNIGEDTKPGNKDTPPAPILVHSKEVWKGNDPGKHMFTTLCPAESTFSLGSFPLLKVLM